MSAAKSVDSKLSRRLQFTALEEDGMNLRAIVGGTALAIVASVGLVSTQTQAPATVDGMVSAAKNAAGLEWAGTFMRLCVAPPPAEPRAAGATPRPGGPPAKASWYAEPA